MPSVILELALRVATESGTPVAVVDEAVMDANLRRMAEFAVAGGVRLRPHGKTHKSVEVARRQLALGASGLTVATLTEAETFAAAGVDDLLIAHPPVGEVKLRRLAALASRVARLGVAVDDLGVASALPAQIEVMWEVDTGQHRIGTPPGEPTIKAVAELVRAFGQSRFRGLITHGGHAYQAKDDSERRTAAAQEANGLLETAALLRSRGIDVRELSIGSTPTMGAHPLEGITEIRPGTYVYGDANQVTLGVMRLEDCALAVAACVVSTPALGSGRHRRRIQSPLGGPAGAGYDGLWHRRRQTASQCGSIERGARCAHLLRPDWPVGRRFRGHHPDARMHRGQPASRAGSRRWRRDREVGGNRRAGLALKGRRGSA